MVDLNLKSRVRAVAAGRAAHGRARQRLDRQHLVGRGGIGAADHAAYGAAKAGLENLTQNFAAALAPHGVRVNCVRVGAIKSEGFLRAMERLGIDPDEIGGRAAGLGRAGVPAEIAWPILFFASAASSYVLGPDPLRRAAARRTSPLDERDRSASSASRTTT